MTVTHTKHMHVRITTAEGETIPLDAEGTAANPFEWYCEELILCVWCSADYYERLEDGGHGRCRRCGDELGTRWTHRTLRPLVMQNDPDDIGVVEMWPSGPESDQVREARDLELRGHLEHALTCALDRWVFDTRAIVVPFNDATVAVVRRIYEETIRWFEEAHDVDLSGVHAHAHVDGFMRTFDLSLTIDTGDG